MRLDTTRCILPLGEHAKGMLKLHRYLRAISSYTGQNYACLPHSVRMFRLLLSPLLLQELYDVLLSLLPTVGGADAILPVLTTGTRL